MKFCYQYAFVSLLLLLSITAYAQPNSNFTSSATEGCASFTVQFTSSEQGTGFTHDWDFGNGIVTGGPTNPSRTYTTVGTYTVKHTITGSNGTTTTTKTSLITVHPTPTADFTASPLAGCPPLLVKFTDKSVAGIGSMTYDWVLGSGATPATSTNANPSATYTTPGLQNVTLKVTNSKGCVHTITKSQFINVYDKPVIAFTADNTEFCSAPAVANFASTSTGAGGVASYAWNLGVGTSAVQNPSNVNYPGPAPAQYNVSLTVTGNNGCTETLTKNAYIRIITVTANFSSTASVCVGDPIKFNNSSTQGSIFSWNFGDGGSSSEKDPAHVYTQAGSYTVTLKAAIGSCSNTITKTVLVRPKPTPSILMNPGIPCPAPSTISFSTNPAMTSYSWTFKDKWANTIGTSTSATPSQVFPTNVYERDRSHYVSVDVVDVFGCKSTVAREITIDTLFTEMSWYSTVPNCVPWPVELKVGLKSLDMVYKPVDALTSAKSYKWNLGDGTTSTDAVPKHTYTDSGQYRVTVEIETTNGCILRDTMIVEVGYKPNIIDFTVTPRVVCPKNWVGFKAKVTGYEPLQYKWFYGDGAIDEILAYDSASHFYKCANVDSFEIFLQVSHYSCFDTLRKPKHVVVLGPCANFSYAVNCPNEKSIKFVDQSVSKTSRIWYFGDGQSATDEIVSHTYATAGYYDVMLVSINTNTGCKDTMTRNIYVGDNPIGLAASKTKICLGDTVKLNTTFSKMWVWRIYEWYLDGNKLRDTGEVIVLRGLTPGQHTIKVIAMQSSLQCEQVIERVDYITVGDPVAGFMTDKVRQCKGDEIVFTDTSQTPKGSTISRRSWSFGGGPGDTLSVSTASTKKKYHANGTYNVRLTVTDNIGCTNTVNMPGYVTIQKPQASFLLPAIGCTRVPILFNNNSRDAVSYEWSFGDGDTSIALMPYHAFGTSGTYTPKLIAIDDIGCRDTFTKVIETTKPVANFTISDSMAVCPPLISNFDAAPSVRAKSFIWNFDDLGAPGTMQRHTIVYNAPKEYNVMLVAVDSLGCMDTTYRSVQVLGYEGAFDYSVSSGCAPLTIDFHSKVKGTVPTMIWDFGDGNTQTATQQQTITYTYNTPGKYIPRLIFNNNQGCVIGSDGADTIVVDGVTPDFDPGPACQFSKVTFNNKSTAVDRPITVNAWTFHTGERKSDKNPDYWYGAPGQYMVKLRVVNAQGCTDSIEKEITVNVPMEMKAGSDTVICLTDSIQMMPEGGVSYTWSPPVGLSCSTCNNPFAFPKVKTIYRAISTDINGCHDTASVEVGIKTHVISTVGDGGEICDGEKIKLSVFGGNRYLWTPGNSVDNPVGQEPIATPNTTTKYRVVSYEGRCIPDTNFVDVIVRPKPTVTVKGEQTIVAGNSADLIASGTGIARFAWTPKETLTCDNCADPVANPYKTTTYTIRVYTQFDCVDSASVTVTVLCDKSQVFIPNTFTPNGDGVNDVFMVRGTGISNVKMFRVYNRWGQVLFDRTNVPVNDAANGWDGTFSGSQLPPDVYIYTVEAYCDNGDLMTFKGDITIIR